ncbi:double-transmembrane region domain protein [Gemmatirosa kalamazoonensis]|uniref:Double-transmembrane region domain protein n=1 Tax=Gemmatirosa kalamazoonensis TaxID=861299 RepID=W0RLU7_9BACT|nr:VWA domain-containing protein [Gemmatirosa kalamazoonensis]AHG91285.1 double-transmembrane region domain protein [Gemmatirosa kalamazoonensis]
MEFLAPWYAALAAAAAVPLLLHFLRRRIGTRLDFPAVRYLERAEQEHSARLRLRNWLLMALRVLAVLLVALAATRPVARVGGAGHAPAAVAIVLDNSLSTTAVVDGRPVFAALRDAALEIVSNAAAEDRVWLVTASGRVVGSDASAVRDAIRALTPLAGAGDLPRAVSRAAELARSARRPSPTVVVLTDGQATAWRTTADAGSARVVTWVPRGAPPRNRAVVAADATPRRWTPSGTVVARVLSADSVPYRVSERDASGGERTLARGTAPPDGEVRVHVTPNGRGWLAIGVAVQPDELRGDDQRWFAAFSGEPPTAVGDPSAGPFVASALATLAQSGRVASAGPRPAQIVSADAATRLPALLVAPSDPARVGPANLALERLGVPWRFAAARFGEAAVRFASGASDSSRLGIVATRRFQLVPRAAARADTLATAGGEAWIVAGPGYVLLGSPLAPDATTFPVRAAFVPWLGEVLAERLGGDPGAVTTAAPGATLEPPAGVDALLGPDGRRIPVAAGVTAPERGGVYFWLRGGARVGALVVNVEAEESELARLNARTLAERIRGTAVDVAPSVNEAAAATFAVRGRRPVGGAALIAALVALAAEGLATRRRRTARAALAAA